MLMLHLLFQSDQYNRKKVKVGHNLLMIEDLVVRKSVCRLYFLYKFIDYL